MAGDRELGRAVRVEVDLQRVLPHAQPGRVVIGAALDEERAVFDPDRRRPFDERAGAEARLGARHVAADRRGERVGELAVLEAATSSRRPSRVTDPPNSRSRASALASRPSRSAWAVTPGTSSSSASTARRRAGDGRT